MTFDAWLAVGCRISRLASASAWALGDWLLFGERAFGDRYRSALAATELDYQTLRNYTSVARRVPAARRRESLSFGHHAEVASLPEPEQDLWLRRAEFNRWSRNELRRQLAACRAGAPIAEREPNDHVVRMSLDQARERRWRQAASDANLTLEAWLGTVADAAAESLGAPAQQGSAPAPPRLTVAMSPIAAIGGRRA